MSNRKLRFRAPIEIRGINPFVLVSTKRAARLKPDWRKPMPVRIQVNGKPDVPWRINMMPAGDGSFFLYLHERVRKASATAVGDTVSVTIAFDDGYKGGPLDPVPSWFRTELRRNPKARRGWDSLPPSRQKEIVRYLVRLKSAQAQQRNVRRALQVLAGGKARFMGRAWEAGR
jgi:Bacteriocin-protection, YdeI or OmpD-Associated/Domain of unknown function (DUF1905)